MDILTVNNFDDFVFKSAMYTTMHLPDDTDLLKTVFINHYALNLYCINCNDIRTFELSNSGENKQLINHMLGASFEIPSIFYNCMRSLTFYCTKEKSHSILVFFTFINNTIIKIGQYPQNITFLFHDKNKYDKLLGKYAIEYKTALQVYSHGTGIGSFVYLRRVLEFLVDEFHQKVIQQKDWNEEDYNNMRFGEKIKAIETYHKIFPDELDGYTQKIYGLLSKGIHELEEEECLELFPTIKFLIERILDERVEKSRQAAKLQEALKSLPPK